MTCRRLRTTWRLESSRTSWDPIDAFFQRFGLIRRGGVLGQVYRATLRETGEEVAIKVQRPGIEPIIYRDLLLFRTLAWFINGYRSRRWGSTQLIVDEFGEKLLEELDYVQEGRNLNDFYDNFRGDPIVKIPKYYEEYSGSKILTMEWIDAIGAPILRASSTPASTSRTSSKSAS